MKTFVFGPWTGEFSYEAQWWVAEIREIALQQKCKTVMVGYPGRDALYRDFIDEYVEFTEELIEYCNNPNCWAQRMQDSRTLFIPDKIMKFYHEVCSRYTDAHVYHPTSNLIDKRFLDNPSGIFDIIHDYDHSVDQIVTDILSKLDKDSNTICIVPKLRLRDSIHIDHETWPLDIWEKVINVCINELQLNVISFLFKVDQTRPGTYDLSHLVDKYKSKFYQVDLKHKKSLDIQIALLKNSMFSIYGSTGAAILPILCNTKMITFQIKQVGWRLDFEWQRKLTNNHRFISIADKYPLDSYKDISIEEISCDIKNFIKKIEIYEND